MRLIDADYLKTWFGEKDLYGYDYIIGTIDDAPTIKPERKKGEWIMDAYGNAMCSECGWRAPQIMTGCLANRHLDYDKSEFCWHCGAYMKGE